MDTSTTVPRTPSLLSDLAPPESSHRHTHVLACTHLMHRHPCRSLTHLQCPGSSVPSETLPGAGFLPSPTNLIQSYLALWSRKGLSCKQWLAFRSESGLKGPRVKEASRGPRVPPSPGHSPTCQLPPTSDIHTLMHTHTPLVPQSQFPGPPTLLFGVCVCLPAFSRGLIEAAAWMSQPFQVCSSNLHWFLSVSPSTPASTFSIRLNIKFGCFFCIFEV